jgi:hypothetical protein
MLKTEDYRFSISSATLKVKNCCGITFWYNVFCSIVALLIVDFVEVPEQLGFVKEEAKKAV